MPAEAQPEFAPDARVALQTPSGETMREGTVIEVVRAGKTLHGYRIRWDDGAVSIFAPSARGLVPLAGEDGGPADVTAA
jgi:Domain of unknown function (DUF1918)